jgi:hypothetical protein
MQGACGVNKTITPHAFLIFITTSKSENHMQNGFARQKKLKMHAQSTVRHTNRSSIFYFFIFFCVAKPFRL